MKHTIYGYARVSTLDQNLDRQIDMLNEKGAEVIFQEKITGTKIEIYTNYYDGRCFSELRGAPLFLFTVSLTNK